MQRRYAKRRRRQMGGSGVDEHANQYVYDNEKSHFAEEGPQKTHVNLPSLVVKLSLWPSITQLPPATARPHRGAKTSLDSSSTVIRRRLSVHVDTPDEHSEIRFPSGCCRQRTLVRRARHDRAVPAFKAR